MKRRLTKLVVFLLLGAIVNVAVAWGCAHWGSIGTWPQRYGGDGERGIDRALRGIWQVQRNERFGMTRFKSTYYANPFGSYWTSPTAAESLLPYWAKQRIEFGESDHRIVLYGAGWPLRALQCRVEFDRVSDGITLKGRLDGRLHRPRAQNVQMPALPYRPIWFGFIGNTLLFALAATSVLAPFGSVTRFRRRRRVRRGGCSMCGYDLRGAEHEVCPECGQNFCARAKA